MTLKKKDDHLIKPGSGRAADDRQGSLPLRIPRSSSSGAIYHLNVKAGSRGRGQSARAKVAYVTRQDKYDRADRDKVLHVESDNMPDWVDAKDDPAAEKYWAAADDLERANGVLFREVEVALPRALDERQNRQLAQDFARELAKVDRGNLPFTMTIHEGRGTNPHAHIVLSERINDGNSRTRETWFRRAPIGARKANLASDRQKWLQDTRQKWERAANGALEAAGRPERIDHRSLKDQGLTREPGQHRGPTLDAMERRGVASGVKWRREGGLERLVEGATEKVGEQAAMIDRAWAKLEAEFQQRELQRQLERGRGGGMER